VLIIRHDSKTQQATRCHINDSHKHCARSSHLHGWLSLWSPTDIFHHHSAEERRLRKEVPFPFVLNVLIRFAIYYSFHWNCELVAALFVPKINQSKMHAGGKNRCLPFGRRKVANQPLYCSHANLVKDAIDGSILHHPFYHADILVHWG
jgi:hypothetical protein